MGKASCRDYLHMYSFGGRKVELTRAIQAVLSFLVLFFLNVGFSATLVSMTR